MSEYVITQNRKSDGVLLFLRPGPKNKSWWSVNIEDARIFTNKVHAQNRLNQLDKGINLGLRELV